MNAAPTRDDGSEVVRWKALLVAAALCGSATAAPLELRCELSPSRALDAMKKAYGPWATTLVFRVDPSKQKADYLGGIVLFGAQPESEWSELDIKIRGRDSSFDLAGVEAFNVIDIDRRTGAFVLAIEHRLSITGKSLTQPELDDIVKRSSSFFFVPPRTGAWDSGACSIGQKLF